MDTITNLNQHTRLVPPLHQETLVPFYQSTPKVTNTGNIQTSSVILLIILLVVFTGSTLLYYGRFLLSSRRQSDLQYVKDLDSNQHLALKLPKNHN